MVNDVKLRKKPQKSENDHSNKSTQDKDEIKPKYGPMPRNTTFRVLSRGVMIIGVMVYVWYYSNGKRESSLAKQNTIYQTRGQHVDCHPDFINEIKGFPGCVPKKCGRFVSDRIVTEYEADILLWFAKRGMALTNVSGGAAIIDLHSGTMSYQDKFMNFYRANLSYFITPTDLHTYKGVREKIQSAVADFFGINVDSLYLTHPTFFSRLSNKEAVTLNDQYWHIHVDKHTYESFHYTTLLYLNDYETDFKGGRFMFVNDFNKPTKNITVEPRKGRVSMFTSGAENPHFVEKVSEGQRYAITISFTCNEKKKINDPTMKTSH
ncbi:2-oxoglutarate and iron-dependent oxygenase domain-containing protein 3-like [Sitophilus oryzae]|uniref:2-oxoglutarate and iron-dependent oxygenase domain-containing protein 3-like n=1 Tax=Sitophilus oryzae TaxID=7048 RepID=A0A6J2Y316_SITOR|nr:2-oxoglutarate and iron-dependent oxygenase domain-containing protein 3-like [Sitophilus oryzae]